MTIHPSDRWSHPVISRMNGGGRRQWWGILRAIEHGELIVPDYQRARVWTPEQQAAFVGFVLSGCPVPAIWIRQVDVVDGDEAGFRDELLDGQQRLHALTEWTAGRVRAMIPWSGEIAVCDSSEALQALTRLSVPICELPPDTTRADALSIYLAINSGGTPHTDADLDRVRRMLEV